MRTCTRGAKQPSRHPERTGAGVQEARNVPRSLTSSPTQVKLNRGLDFINLDDILVDLKLGPEVLEVS
jgi:hypothetical protein